MTRTQAPPLHDQRTDVKIVLGGMWISMLFVFAFVDIFAFWRADVINGALVGKIPVTGFTINQSFLLNATLYVLLPSLMVTISLLTPARLNRPANLVASLVYLASVVVTMVGETWMYYLVGSTVEVLLLLAIARAAWTWPRRPLAG